MSGKSSIKETMNAWGAACIPFIFIIDFEQKEPLIFRVSDVDPDRLLYNLNGVTNSAGMEKTGKTVTLVRHPESFDVYDKKFRRVKDEIMLGNSYLVNLTCSTPVEINLSLKEIFTISNARYRIWYDERFVCFSPEIFVTIKDGIISSYPMKGTIDDAIADAESVIMNDTKETAEHYTIVDLIRNDLNMVARNVHVKRFRYIDRIKTHERTLLQVSSEISGLLDDGYESHIGDIIHALLPAGSVSGAPKKKTTEIILDTEGYSRGYYTGVAGIFDGRNLDSCVMIRFIERGEQGLLYRSGGGITSFSNAESEYQEMINKIYVPVN